MKKFIEFIDRESLKYQDARTAEKYADAAKLNAITGLAVVAGVVIGIFKIFK